MLYLYQVLRKHCGPQICLGVMFFSGRAFACGMRETFEPDIVIEDVSYDTFYALLEFLSLKAVTGGR